MKEDRVIEILKGKVPDVVISKILRRGLSLEEIVVMSDLELAEELGIDKGIASEILRTLSKEFLKPITADELLTRRKTVLSSGIRDLDRLLNGGLPVNTITGIYGPPGSGKTQLSLQFTARSLLDLDKGGLSTREAIFIDSEGSFEPRRSLDFLKLNGLKEEDLSRIRVLSAPGPYQLKESLRYALDFVRKDITRFVCIDSISHPFKRYKGFRELYKRQSELQESLNILKRIAELGAVVIATIHATKWGKEVISVGGSVLGLIPQNMLHLRRVRENIVIVTLEDSSYLPRGQAAFRITKYGIEDI